MLVFYCSECGRESREFSGVVNGGENCPAIKGCKMGHNVRTRCRLDAVNLCREMSREKFAAMPKQQRIPDKRRKPSRYKQDWRRHDD